MILEQIYCIRWFGAMSGRFNFSNLQQTKEGGVNRPTSTFSALASTILVQGLHSHYNSSLPTHTNTHSLPLSCSGTTHSSVQCLSFPSASLSSGKHECLLWAEAQLKVCLHPAPPSLGWFLFRFFSVFLAVLSRELQTKPSFLWGNFRTRNVVWTFIDKGTFNVSAPVASWSSGRMAVLCLWHSSWVSEVCVLLWTHIWG